MWNIGKVKIENPVVLAPMAGISNAAFRQIAKRFGAGLIVSEMISDQGIHFRNKKTLEMLYIAENEHPISTQIFGGSAESLTEAAVYVAENTKTDMIDINLGCPVKKVIKANAGSQWLLDPDRLYHMVDQVSHAIDLPLTVKMRIGWDAQHINALENAQAAQAGGAAALAMHGRTSAQMYTGHADWEILKKVSAQLTIPFIGNGDVRTPEDAKRMLTETGASGVMIGRAALGNPWLIRRTVEYLTTGTLLPEPAPEEKIALALTHLQSLIQLKGEKAGTHEFRQHAAYYLKGIPHAAPVKSQLYQAETEKEVRSIFNVFLERIA